MCIRDRMYSDHDIFYRELISNGCDAITKLKKLDLIGEYEAPDDIEYKIQVKVSPEKKTIQIIDNGIGMTKEEVNEYINQIAFSGAEAFLEKYKDKTNEDQIIEMCIRDSFPHMQSRPCRVNIPRHPADSFLFFPVRITFARTQITFHLFSVLH